VGNKLFDKIVVKTKIIGEGPFYSFEVNHRTVFINLVPYKVAKY